MNEELIEASKKGDIDKVIQLVKNNIDINLEQRVF